MIDANAVRPGSEGDEVLVHFPDARILHARTPGDEVAVTHRGETTIYDTPQHLADEIARRSDPQLAGLLRAARTSLTSAESRLAEATKLRDEWRGHAAVAASLSRLAQRRERRLHRMLTSWAIAGVLAAILAVGLGL